LSKQYRAKPQVNEIKIINNNFHIRNGEDGRRGARWHKKVTFTLDFGLGT